MLIDYFSCVQSQKCHMQNVAVCALIYGVTHPHFRLAQEDNSKWSKILSIQVVLQLDDYCCLWLVLFPVIIARKNL